MKIFQPIVSGSIFFPSLITSSAAISNVIMQGTDGQLFITASSAIGGGGGGGPVDTSGLVTTSSFNNYTSSAGSIFAGTSTTANSGSNFVITSTLRVDETLTDFAKVSITTVASWNLFQQTTGSWTSAHGRYTVYKGTNSRAGEFVTSWNGTVVSYYDNATVDIGNTTDITFQSLIPSNQVQINAVAASSGWTVKMLITYL